MTRERFLELMKGWNISEDKYSIDDEQKATSYVLEKISDDLYVVYYYEMSKDNMLYFQKLEDAYFALACLIRYHLVDKHKTDIVI